ncbi:MAG: c-type cytochrome, partial [Pirellulales bacterium]|nr:c-type cytochrome [Pirellulales bacterium]
NLKRDDIMAVVVDADFSKEQREQLAQLCLGVPTAPAANLALTFLQSNPKAIQNLGDAISPLLRYVSEERLHEVYDLAIDFRAERMPKRKRKDGDEGGLEQAILLGLHRAAQERGIELPQEIRAWAQEYAISNLAARRGSIRELGIEVAREIKLQAALPQLLEIAENDIGSDLRIGALIACVTIDGPGSVEMLNRMMHKEQEELALRQRAARSLGTVNNDAARAHLVGFLATAPERLAVEVAAALAKSKPGGETLLATIAAGKASPRLLQEPPVSAQLAQQNIPGLAEQIEKLTAGLPSRDEQLRQVIEDRLAAFAKHKPDLARGKQVFTKNCGVCHKLSGEGAKIGPELDGIGVRGPSRLMEDILDPNRNVDQAFRTTLLTTVEGQPISGLLLRQEGKVLILVDSQGKEQRLSEDDIEPDSKQVSPLSPMPANHRDTIPEAEFYDLLGYLLEQKPKE